MKSRWIAVLSLLCVVAAYSKDPIGELQSIQGHVYKRSVHEHEWNPVSGSDSLVSTDELYTEKDANATIVLRSGTRFELSESAMITINELLIDDKNDLLLEIAAQDLQKLPSRAEPMNVQENVYQLHGALQDSPKEHTAATETYQQRQERAALMLLDQGFEWSFIFKYSRLKEAFPGHVRSDLDHRFFRLLQTHDLIALMERYQKKG